MKVKGIIGITVAVLVVALLLAWNAITAQTAKELSAALARAQAETRTITQRLDNAEQQNAVLRSALSEYEAKETQRVVEEEFRQKLESLPKMTSCTVSHYCCEKHPHICGTGNGITASGEPVQANVSVAVDPKVIPLGSTVYVDYGDGVVHTYIAHDTGGAVKGNHIDVAVETHDEALRLGLRKATVWWEEN